MIITPDNDPSRDEVRDPTGWQVIRSLYRGGESMVWWMYDTVPRKNLEDLRESLPHGHVETGLWERLWEQIYDPRRLPSYKPRLGDAYVGFVCQMQAAQKRAGYRGIGYNLSLWLLWMRFVDVVKYLECE